MKLFLTVLMLIGANAYAGQCNKDCSGLIYDWPSVSGVTINNLCQTETGFKSLIPVSVCKATTQVPNWACDHNRENCVPVSDNYQPKQDEWIEYKTVCSSRTLEVVQLAKIYQATECEPCYPVGESDSCVTHQPVCRVVTKTIPTTYYVDTYVAGSENAEGGRQWAGMKKYAIPACK